MKNHYKIHAQHNQPIDHDKEEGSTTTNHKDELNAMKNSLTESSTTSRAAALKTEMLDWLRSDFDRVEISTTTTKNQTTSETVIQSMENLHVREQTTEEFVHLD